MALEDLEGLIKGLESQESWQAQRQFRLVVQYWPKTVGFAVARQTRPVSIQRATLYVATSTPVWAQTLFYERIKILKKLNRHQRQPIKNIRFSTAQWGQLPRPTRPATSLKQHPSYIEPAIAPQVFKDPPQTPLEAFNRWAQAIQQNLAVQAFCPQCRCHCPQGELDRWDICAMCAAKSMRSVR